MNLSNLMMRYSTKETSATADGNENAVAEADFNETADLKEANALVKEKKRIKKSASATSSTSSMRNNLASNLMSNSKSEIDPANESKPNVVYLKKLLKKLNIASDVCALVSGNTNVTSTTADADDEEKPIQNIEEDVSSRDYNASKS